MNTSFRCSQPYRITMHLPLPRSGFVQIAIALINPDFGEEKAQTDLRSRCEREQIPPTLANSINSAISPIENYFPLIPAWSIAACIAFHDSASGLFTSTATIFALGK